MSRAVVGALLLVLAMPVGLAQAQEVAPYSIVADVGIGGFVARTEPTVLRVDVSADLLLVGTLQVTMSGIRFDVPVEVPAGGTKTYDVALPPAGTTRAVNVGLVPDGAEDAIISERIVLLFPGDETLVGVLAGPPVAALLNTVRSVPIGRPVRPLLMDRRHIGPEMATLPYIIVDSDISAYTADEIDAIRIWVTAGGRLVGPPEVAAVLDFAPGVAIFDTNAVVSRVGRGEVVVVPNPDSVDAAVWSSILRDIPAPLVGRDQFGFQGLEINLIQAATVGTSAVPGLPWLLGALAGYVVIVGPLNFMYLRRRGKAEWAWVTVPAIAAIAVAGFWLVGRQQVQSRIVQHATVVVQDGNAPSEATSAMAIMAGGAGSHDVAVPSDWSISPIDLRGQFGASGRLTSVKAGADQSTITFELENLEAGAMRADWEPERLPITVDVAVVDNRAEITVTNDSDFDFWSWGVGFRGWAQAGNGALGPGESVTASIAIQQFREPFSSPLFDAMVSETRFSTGPGINTNYEIMWPMAQAALQLGGDIVPDRAYFYGLTDDLRPVITVGSSTSAVDGTALVLVAAEPSAATESSGEAAADVLGLEGNPFIEGDGLSTVFIINADAVVFRYLVPQGLDAELSIPNLANRFGGQLPADIEAYDWSTGEFESVGWPAVFDSAGKVSAGGEVVARLVFANQEFSEVFPTAFPLQWETP